MPRSQRWHRELPAALLHGVDAPGLGTFRCRWQLPAPKPQEIVGAKPRRLHRSPPKPLVVPMAGMVLRSRCHADANTHAHSSHRVLPGCTGGCKPQYSTRHRQNPRGAWKRHPLFVLQADAAPRVKPFSSLIFSS